MLMKKALPSFYIILLIPFFWLSALAQSATSIVINEVAYRGTVASGTDEWIELANPWGQPIDLAGWKFFIGSSETMLKGVIPAGDYFLLERTNDQTISDIPADQIFTGSLTDSGVVLKLVNPAGQTVDQVSKWFVNLEKPPQGYSIRSSMERVDGARGGDDAGNWAINNQNIRNGLDAKGNLIMGTPRQRNSVAIVASGPPVVPPPQQPVVEPPQSVPSPAPVLPQTPPSDSSTPLPPSPPQVGRNDKVMIWRFLANPKGRDDEAEWIELKNRGQDPVDLNGYRLASREGAAKPVPINGTIPTGKSLRFFSRDTKLILRNTGDKIRLFDPKGQLIDELEWKTEIREGVIMLRQDLSFTPDSAVVVGTIDGDTITVEIQDQPLPAGSTQRKETVRLIGIDTPETVHPDKPVEFFGKESSAYTKQELTGKTVRLEYGDEKRDDYGRLLAFVFIGDRHFNAELIEKGFARAYLRYPFRYAEAFKKLEDSAKAQKLGLWAGDSSASGQGSAVTPMPGPPPLGDLSNNTDPSTHSTSSGQASLGTGSSPPFDPLLKRILNRLNALFRRLLGREKL